MFFISLQSGYNTRIKAVHILNARPWAESLISMLKFVVKKKIAERVSLPAYFLSFSTQNLVTKHIQGVPGEMCQTSGGCSLC